MQYITTKSSHGEKGRKVYARASGGCSVRRPWDYALSAEENHNEAARALVAKLKWKGGKYAVAEQWKGGFVYVNIVDTIEL